MWDKPLTDYKNFEALDISVGTVIKAERLKEAHKPAYVMTVDFGELGMRKSSAQITENYLPENLIGTQVIGIVNFPKKQIANLLSECLILGVVSGEGVVLLRPDKEVKNGSRIA